MNAYDPARLFGDYLSSLDPESPDYERERDLAGLAFRAVFDASPHWRNQTMPAEIDRELVRAGVSPAVRTWIGWVLHEVEIPHRAHHRPVDHQAKLEFSIRLAQFVLEHERKKPDVSVLHRLHDAAGTLHKSFGSIKAAYYSKKFKVILNTLRTHENSK